MKTLTKNYIRILGVITAVNIAMLLIRNYIEGNSVYNFLFWNLFLGFLPLLFAYILYIFKEKLSAITLIIGSGIWLLFYPNAPYMISDLIHVDKDSSTVIYDTLIIFSISILSIFYGFFSLKIIHLLWRNKWSVKRANIFIVFALLMSSFGIYLGRILRLNSWDLFTNPLKVLSDVIHHLWPINQNPTTYYIVLLFSIIQYILLVMTKDLEEL